MLSERFTSEFPACATLPGQPSAFSCTRRTHAQLRLHRPHDAGRSDVEGFIAETYLHHFDAHVTQFTPELVSIREGDRIVAAAGYRVASDPLFLERYLDEPVEAVLGRCTGRQPQRETIVEIGHLSLRRANDGRTLLPALARHLAARNLQWGVSTLTEELRRLLTRMGIATIVLGAADVARLGSAATSWGTYYEHRPVVVAAPLPLAAARLDRWESGR